MTPSFIYCAVHVPVNSFAEISTSVPNRTNLLHLNRDLQVIRLLQLSPVLLLLDNTAVMLYYKATSSQSCPPS